MKRKEVTQEGIKANSDKITWGKKKNSEWGGATCR